jgi:hypothetical protein
VFVFKFLIRLLVVCAGIPLLVEHLFVHEHLVGTVTHGEVNTMAPVASSDERSHLMHLLEKRRGKASKAIALLAQVRR